MKTFMNFKITLPPKQVEQFIVNISERLPQHWERDIEKEKSLKYALPSGQYFIFTCRNKALKHDAALFLIEHGNGIITLANIIPRDVSELTIEEYNNILDDFYQKNILPFALSEGYLCEKSSGTTALQDIVCHQTADALIAFSSGANKETGSAHPCDKTRWYDFIISVHNNHDQLDTYFLKRWLVEEGGWSLDKAMDLVIEYEMEIGLLKRYSGEE